MIEVLAPVLRAAAQAAVAGSLAFLAVHGLPVPPEVAGVLVLALTAVLTGLVARGQQYLERRYPSLGALLRTPIYSPGLNRLRVADKRVRIAVDREARRR